MQAFILRPFGVKKEIDFDQVERELIQPALKALNITGATTSVIVEQGNIREDMFAQLLLADLVIADLSIHNANVFYELGVRHALRDKKTFLIRCSIDEIPFDLKTDRYLTYPAENPAECLEALVKGLKATLLSDRADSPVFFTLPRLKSQNPEDFLIVPSDFGAEVEIATECKQKGTLALLAAEINGFSWVIPGLRIIGENQFMLKANEDARITWESIRNKYPNDQEANDKLSTIYQRLAENAANPQDWMKYLALSDQAVNRLLEHSKSMDRHKLAEVYSLRARNEKSRWINSWKDLPQEKRYQFALLSPFLSSAFKDYEWAYNRDLNHYYSGINALSLLKIKLELANLIPEVWEINFDSLDDAANALRKFKIQYDQLKVMIKTTLEARKKQLNLENSSDRWLDITLADLCCLTYDEPARVGILYFKALNNAENFQIEAARRQLLLYEQLNILQDNVKEALKQFPQINSTQKRENNYILFTGHMIDKPGRQEPRFPPEKEQEARNAIFNAVKHELERIEGPVVGISGGASGGDIIFHEVCEELKIPAELYLALPREKFLTESVQFAGPDWVNRFDRLFQKLPVHILAEKKDLPNWLQKKKDYSIWERNNLWMLYNALVNGGIKMSLIALWNGQGGDGSGGTEHMVKEAKERGAKTIIIDTQKIFGLKN